MDNVSQLVGLLQEHGAQFLQMVTITFMRPLGLLYGFIGIVWAIGGTTLLVRTGIAFAFAVPVMVNEYNTLLQYISQTNYWNLFFIYIKEFGIGMLIGLMLSVPFWIVQFGGSIIDSYRGENNSGATDPTGGEVSTIANYHIVVAFLVFASLGGMSYMVGEFYKSYQLWGITDVVPISQARSVTNLLDLFNYIMYQGLIVASPLLFAMMAIDFIALISSKVAKGFNATDSSFAFKNLLTLIVLPIIAVIYVNSLQDNFFKNIDILGSLKKVF